MGTLDFEFAPAAPLSIASLRDGRLVFLDTFPDDAELIGPAALRRSLDLLPRLLSEAREQLRLARSELVDSPRPREAEWSSLEEAANRHYELERASRGHAGLRVKRGHLLPERAFALYDVSTPQVSSELIGAMVERAKDRERRHARQLEGLYRYRLTAKNCVSEIFRTINGAFEEPRTSPESRLSGSIDGRHSLSFIPFVSAALVNGRYPVVERSIFPSLRESRLRAMALRESPLVVALRESNTVTAKSYRRSQGDTFFLFFTDRALLLRPLFGALNLVGALGESVAGLLRIPDDGGRMFGSGLTGAMMSLPELAFGNIRKGTNDWVEPEERQLPD